MSRVVPWSALDGPAGPRRPPLAAEALTRPDGGVALVDGGRVVASAALWWRGPLATPGPLAGGDRHAESGPLAGGRDAARPLAAEGPAASGPVASGRPGAGPPTTSPLPPERPGEGRTSERPPHARGAAGPLAGGGGAPEPLAAADSGPLAAGSGAVGRIGHVAWPTAAAGAELLAGAVDRLQAEGATRAVGPLDGSTWFDYRVVTDPAPGGVQAPRFALEPWPGPAVAPAFRAAGFAPVARYLSSRVGRLPDASARAAADLDRLRRRGVTVRSFRPGDAARELAALHGLLLAAFARNPYYAPLDLGRFQALYRPLVRRVDPELVVVAQAEGRPVGVLLAVPDWAQAERGGPVDAVVCKTLAVDPAWQGGGVGGALTRVVQERARRGGAVSAVHALMHDGNASVRISRHLGTPVRRYALLGRDL